MMKDVSALILAAGKSSRMGQPKMFLDLKQGMSFLENLLIQFADFGCHKIAVVTSKEGQKLLKKKSFAEKYLYQIVLNGYPEKQRLYSIQCGLKQLQESEYVFIQNADNPFADLETLQKLYEKRNHADYIKPVSNNRGGHPVLISRKITKKLVELTDFEIPLNAFLNKFSYEKVEINNDHIFVNINNESDYLRLIKPKEI